MDKEDHVAALQTFLTKAFLLKAVLVVVLWVEWAIIPLQAEWAIMGNLCALYVSFMQDFTALLIAEFGISSPCKAEKC